MVGFQLRLTLTQIKLHASMNLLFIIQSSTLIAMERSTSRDECCLKQVLLACYSKQLLRSNFVMLSHRQPSKYSIFHKTRCCKMYTQQLNVINKSSDLLTDLIPEPTARSAVRRGLLIPLGYLHPGKSEHSEVKSPSMIAGASLWFVA